MKGILLISVITSVFVSFGLTGKCQNAKSSVYVKVLTPDDIKFIAQNGETTKEIELSDPGKNNLSKGRLRILRTDNNGIFNFIEVGHWIEHGRYGNSGRMRNIEFRDTIVYDNNGNTLSRRVYDRHDGEFEMTNYWTSENIEGAFIQHFKVYDKGTLRAEYSKKVLDFTNPKPDLEKNKIPYGVDKGYYANGELGYVKTYDQNGKLISGEKYRR